MSFDSHHRLEVRPGVRIELLPSCRGDIVARSAQVPLANEGENWARGFVGLFPSYT